MASVGIKLSSQNCTIEELRTLWHITDDAGFDHLWGFDHFNPIFADVAGDVFEGMTLLAAMAEATTRVRIGLMVTGKTCRSPVVRPASVRRGTSVRLGPERLGDRAPRGSGRA